MTTHDDDMKVLDTLATLRITKTDRRHSVGGKWVTGTIAGHYPHADSISPSNI